MTQSPSIHPRHLGSPFDFADTEPATEPAAAAARQPGPGHAFAGCNGIELDYEVEVEPAERLVRPPEAQK